MPDDSAACSASQFRLAAGEQAVLRRHGAAEDAWGGAGRGRLAARHRQDDAAALGGVGDAVQVAVGGAGQQAGGVVVVAAQQADAARAVGGGDRGEEVMELLPGPEAAVVVGAIEDQQVARLLQRVVDGRYELAAGGEVVVLDADTVSLGFEDIGDLPRHCGDAAAAAKEEVIRERQCVHRHDLCRIVTKVVRRRPCCKGSTAGHWQPPAYPRVMESVTGPRPGRRSAWAMVPVGAKAKSVLPMAWMRPLPRIRSPPPLAAAGRRRQLTAKLTDGAMMAFPNE